MAIIENQAFETNLGVYAPWFGCTVARDNGAAHGGSWSMLATTTDMSGAAVLTNNFPYYSITAGNSYDFSVWYIESTATMPTVTWELRWYDSGVTQLSMNTISLPRATSWTQASGTFTAPANAVTLGWDFFWITGVSGSQAVRFDDVLVQDSAVTASRPVVCVGPSAAVMRAVL